MNLRANTHQAEALTGRSGLSHRYRQLQALQQSGQISQLVVQPSFHLVPSWASHFAPEVWVCYTADFAYKNRGTGQLLFEGATKTQGIGCRIKHGLVRWIYGIRFYQA